MNRFLTPLIFLLLLLLSVSACKTHKAVWYPVPTNPTAKRMPPGQAKKVYGHQSAKAFAPGQQKMNDYSKVKSSAGNIAQKGKGKK